LTFEDVFKDVLGFPLFEQADAVDFLFRIDDVLWDIVAGEAFRCGGGDAPPT
jgi:hypothetical protein